MLQTLELTQFRSYQNGLFGFEPGVNIIVGPNASGKTNLLEAIHVICRLQGFRVADKDLFQLDTDWLRLEALTDSGARVVKMKNNAHKVLELDGVSKKRLTSTTALPVVVFEPDHMLLLGSEPDRRRTYLDSILVHTQDSYQKTLREYKRILSQRNRLLKQDNLDQSQLFAWDVQLADRAGLIIQKRLDLCEQLQHVCGDHYRSISNNSEDLQISYESKIPIEGYSHHFIAYLKENYTTDRQRGFTGAGPHRDDVRIQLKEYDARTTASRGETRSIILALKIAELELLHNQTNIKPVLLLDDVFSELDGTRRRMLAEALQDYQTFLTTTDADVAVDHFSAYNIIPMG